MKKPYPRIVIAAPSSGSGKTTVVCGLLKVMLQEGIRCVSFKCGPDYIDPMFHKYVLGVAGGNLDSYFLEERELKRLFCTKADGAELSVIEGVMGYYDGLGGVSTAASTYEVACLTDSPVVLVVDGKGASLSVAAMIKGFLDYRADHHICGVILNRVTKASMEALVPFIEELGIKVLGAIPNNPLFRFESRHLGLLVPGEIEDLNQKLSEIAEQIRENVDLEEILRIAGNASCLESDADNVSHTDLGSNVQKPPAIRIAVARDEAFCFYYQENLELLEYMGAELVYFSPIKDEELPGGIQGLLLGGGYPENHAERLAENKRMRHAVLAAAEDDMPILAECGGFLYLMDRLEGSDGKLYPMAGVIHGEAYRTKRLSRFGYIELERVGGSSADDRTGRIKAHEFHYWDTTFNGTDFMARKPVGGKQWECMHAKKGLLAGFPHLYYPSNPEMIAGWLGCCRERR